MRRIAGLGGIALLAACAGAPTVYETVGAMATPVNMIDCAADAITDEGFVITDRNDQAGLLEAAYGTGFDDADDATTWLKVNVIGADPNGYVIRVTTSDDDTSRESAQEIMEECGT
jgi:hypothetical protein